MKIKTLTISQSQQLRLCILRSTFQISKECIVLGEELALLSSGYFSLFL